MNEDVQSEDRSSNALVFVGFFRGTFSFCSGANIGDFFIGIVKLVSNSCLGCTIEAFAVCPKPNFPGVAVGIPGNTEEVAVVEAGADAFPGAEDAALEVEILTNPNAASRSPNPDRAAAGVIEDVAGAALGFGAYSFKMLFFNSSLDAGVVGTPENVDGGALVVRTGESNSNPNSDWLETLLSLAFDGEDALVCKDGRSGVALRTEEGVSDPIKLDRAGGLFCFVRDFFTTARGTDSGSSSEMSSNTEGSSGGTVLNTHRFEEYLVRM